MNQPKSSAMKKKPGFFRAITQLLAITTTTCSFLPLVEAADRVILKVGPLEKSVQVQDLEDFAHTGKLSKELQSYSMLLTPQLQQALNSNLHVNPTVADKFVNDLFNSPEGERLVRQLNSAFVDTSTPKLKYSFMGAVTENNQLSVLSFLKAYPENDVKIDLTAAVNLAFQLNASYFESKAIAGVLENDLKVETISFPGSHLTPTVSTRDTVYRHTRVLEDLSRDRTLVLDIYYQQHTQGPLVVMSHGFGADRGFLGYLARHLASYGFTVVSVEHPGSNMNSLEENAQKMDLGNLLPSSEFIDRPKDISFVLDELAKTNQQEGYLKGKLNTNQVTIIGHSFGGYTALALAGVPLDLKQLRAYCQSLNLLGRSPADWLQCAAANLPESQLSFKDSRVVQVMAFNPIIGQIFGDNLQQLKIPTLILASTEDGITPVIAHQLKPFAQISGEKYLVTAVGATHLSVTNLKNLQMGLGSNTLVKEILGEETQSLRQTAQALSLAFISQLTPQAAEYRPFLTPGYIQSLSSPTIKLRLNTQLPLSVNAWLNILHYGSQQMVLQSPPKTEPILEENIASSFFKTIEDLFMSHTEVLPEPKSCIGSLQGIFINLLEGVDHPSV